MSEGTRRGHLGPEKSLPYSDAFASSEEYVDSLLDYIGNNDLLTTLCGGVHVLDFFTTTPDLYFQILPEAWRSFFRQHDIMDILDLLMREDLDTLPPADSAEQWRSGPLPPASLLDYIYGVRKHLLDRAPAKSQCSRNRSLKNPNQKLARHVSVGMNVKKVHEVGLFASYVRDLTSSLSEHTGRDVSHLIDFGSGQNYLGRALASQPYNMNIVAIESKGHNQDRAIEYDVMAKLRAKEKVLRNKKIYRAQMEGRGDLPTPPEDGEKKESHEEKPAQDSSAQSTREGTPVQVESPEPTTKVQLSAEGQGTIQYVEHWIENGDLSNVTNQIVDPHATSHNTSQLRPDPLHGPAGFSETAVNLPDTNKNNAPDDRNLVIISLHSCGNLVHHGLRSLTANPSVRAVALIGCCYNKITERLQPATYKLPALRPAAHPRVEREATRADPHGFPMSARLVKRATADLESGAGLRMNITARMMAVQAPQNWGKRDSDNFFTRHFYRALLQRVFLDRGIVGEPTPECVGGSALGHSSGTPIIIGSLPKAAYASFPAYVRTALGKLTTDAERGWLFREKMEGVTDAELEGYEWGFRERKKELSVVWSLMAFSAGVVESLVVVDRWLWLREQEEVGEAWVECVFNYAVSPRNLVVVGVRR